MDAKLRTPNRGRMEINDFPGDQELLVFSRTSHYNRGLLALSSTFLGVFSKTIEKQGEYH